MIVSNGISPFSNLVTVAMVTHVPISRFNDVVS